MVEKWMIKWYAYGKKGCGAVAGSCRKGGISMTIAEMRKRKRELGYTYEKIAELSGVPLGTVQKVFTGVTSAPRYDTLQALEGVFRKQADRAEEAVAAYRVKRQGEYTLDDYYALPDERRVELIDGVIYDMASPTPVHQMLCTGIWNPLHAYIRKEKGNCIPMIAPLDVQLDCDNKTMLQPDVLVVCDRSKIIRRCVCGAPDFVVEILSPATRKKDMFVKLNKYMNAGVREYWIIDPEQKKILSYDLEHLNYPVIYGFDAKVPVGIFGGECTVDFAAIYEYISFLYEEEQQEEDGNRSV